MSDFFFKRAYEILNRWRLHNAVSSQTIISQQVTELFMGSMPCPRKLFIDLTRRL